MVVAYVSMAWYEPFPITMTAMYQHTGSRCMANETYFEYLMAAWQVESSHLLYGHKLGSSDTLFELVESICNVVQAHRNVW